MGKFKLNSKIQDFASINRDKIINIANNGRIWYMNMPEDFFIELLQGKISYAAFDWDYNIKNIIEHLKTSHNHTLRYISILHPFAVYYLRFDNGLFHIREQYQSNECYWD